MRKVQSMEEQKIHHLLTVLQMLFILKLFCQIAKTGIIDLSESCEK